MAAPVFVAEYENASWIDNMGSKAISVSVTAGDLLVVIGMTCDTSVILSAPSGGVGMSYTQRQMVTQASAARTAIWTATAPTTQGPFNVTITRSGSGFMWGMTVLRFNTTDGPGASSGINATGAPSLGITTTRDSSALVVASSDWVHVDGTATRVWRTPSGGSAATERSFAWETSNYTIYAATHASAGTAGAKTVGLSAPTGQTYSIAALEILGTIDPPIAFNHRNNPQATRRASYY